MTRRSRKDGPPTPDEYRDELRAHRDRQLGKMGAASPCRRIDPETGHVVDMAARGEAQQPNKPSPRSARPKTKTKRRLPPGTLDDAAARIVAENERRHPLLRTIR